MLREELEKEEFYVEYLEHLLADVEKQKTRAAGDGEAAIEDASSRTDSSESGIESSETSRKFSKSCSQNSIDLCISELADVVPSAERSKCSPPTGSERSVSVDDSRQKSEEAEPRPRSSTQPDLSNFVTVIEINGKGKKKVELPKKCPPKPPPKTFLRVDLDAERKADASFDPEKKKRAAPTVPSPVNGPSAAESAESLAAGEPSEQGFKNEVGEPPYGKINKPNNLKVEETVNDVAE